MWNGNNTNFFYIYLTFVVMAVTAANAISDVEIVPRSAWNAREAKNTNKINKPVPYVVIHHTYIPPACNSSEICKQAMRSMQDYHQINKSWWDIGYNFAVGGDEKVYEGRGWDLVGAHAPSYNNISMGICLIGDWTVSLPPEDQLALTQQLIAVGVREGHIAENYRLVGHRQVRVGTECPGDALYNEIKKWPHFYDPTEKGEKPRPKAGLPEVDNKLGKRAVPLFNALV